MTLEWAIVICVFFISLAGFLSILVVAGIPFQDDLEELKKKTHQLSKDTEFLRGEILVLAKTHLEVKQIMSSGALAKGVVGRPRING